MNIRELAPAGEHGAFWIGPSNKAAVPDIYFQPLACFAVVYGPKQGNFKVVPMVALSNGRVVAASDLKGFVGVGFQQALGRAPAWVHARAKRIYNRRRKPLQKG